jgi:hypothetical protein
MIDLLGFLFSHTSIMEISLHWNGILAGTWIQWFVNN